MTRLSCWLPGVAALWLGLIFSSAALAQSEWQQLPAFPNERGVAAPLVGIFRNTLLVGGGANFPDRMPWEGGTKVWHDRIYALDLVEGKKWREVGRLPHPLAYAVTVSTSDGVICVGGSDAKEHEAHVLCLALRADTLQITELPSLPQPIANACGAVVGNTLYLAGGLAKPDDARTLSTFLALDLSADKPKWQKLKTWPGPPRMLGVAAVLGEDFYLLSGVDLVPGETAPKRRYLRDAYRYRPGDGWQRIANLPHSVAAAPSPALTIGELGFVVLGGDDGKQVGFTPAEKHPGFSRQALVYHAQTDTWKVMGEIPVARVTTSLIPWHDSAILVSGEVRPGVRSPEVWQLKLKPDLKW